MKRWIAYIALILMVAGIPAHRLMAYPVLSTSGAGTITTTEILDGTITADDIATSAVGTAEILDNTIIADDIAPGAVGTSEILDGTIAGGDLSATIDIATTGTIQGAVKVLDNVTSPSGTQLYGGVNLMTADATVTVVAGSVGMNFCVMDGAATASNLIFDVPGTDNVILLGVEGAAGIGITNTSGSTLGDYVCFMVVTANKWRVMGYQGSWVSQ
jgi:hypothetical protein